MLFSVALFFSLGVVSSIHGTNITVMNGNDSGSGSLRAAITTLNGSGGPHNITFDPSVTIVNLTSNLPAITKQISIDGGGTVTISVPAGDGGYTMFSIGTGGGGSTLKGMTIQNTGFIPIRITAALSNITLMDLVIKNNSNNYIDYAVLCDAAMTDMVVKNVDIKNIQFGTFWGLLFNGNVDGLNIENVDISESGGGDMRAIQFQGATNTDVTIKDCVFDIKYSSNPALFDADEGNYGIYFNNAATNVMIDNVDIPTAEIYCVRTNTITNITIKDCNFGNSRGYGAQISIRFEGIANGVNIIDTEIDQDHTASLDDADYGVYFNTNATDVTLDGVTMHDTEIHGLFVGGNLDDCSILNSTFDNYDGWEGNLMIQFNGTTTDLIMTNVTINEDKSGTADDGDYGIRFIGAVDRATITNVSVREADIYGVQIWQNFKNVTWNGGVFLKNATGIRGDNCNYDRRNVVFQNMRIDSSTTYGIALPICLGGLTDSVAIISDTIRYSGTDGIYLWHGNSSTNYFIKNCVITGNGRTTAAGDGIQITAPDNVVITENSIYDNAGLGINLTGNGNCNMEGAIAPIINSVTPIGGNQYTVNFSIPVAAGPGTFKVEFFTNNPVSGVEGEYFVSSLSGLSAGLNQTTTITTNTGPAANPKTANLTMTYRRTGASCNGTSEFSNAMALDPQGPACVNSGIIGWYRPDKLTGYSNGQAVSQLLDFSGTGNKFKQFVAAEQPTYFAGDVTTNYNPSLTFDGTNDNFEISSGILPINTGGTLLFSAYHINTAASWGDLYNQNIDDPTFGKWAGIPDMKIYDNGNYANNITTMKWVNNISALGGMDYGTTTGTTHGLFNGVSTGNLGAIPSPEAGIGYIGGENTGESWNGKIHEAIFYNRQLTAVEKQRINSYLSIKWGVSIDTSIMKVAAPGNDYQTSDGTVIWTANTTYYHRITGIGRDDCDGLLQKQSRNVNTSNAGYVAIGLGTIAANNPSNSNNFAADKSFMVWGDDGKTGSTTTTITGDGNIMLDGGVCAQYSRLAKTFKVQETGTVGNVQLKFNMMSVKLGKTAADYYLAINNSSVFNGVITLLVPASSYNNVTGELVFDNVDFSNGQFFTVVGKRVYGPANVTGNLKLWLKAEDGIAGGNGDPIETWADQGPVGNDVTQATVANQPTYYTTSNLINFNPSVKFDGANDILLKANGVLANGTTYTGATLFSVNNSENSAAGQRIFRQPAPGVRDVNLYAPYANRTIFDAPWTDRLDIANTAYSNKQFIISTGVKDNSGANTPAGVKQVIYNNAKSIGTGNGTLTYTGGTDALSIGSNNVGSEFHNGYLGEMIFYTAALTATERQKINSYLSLKWGVSLDQTTAYDYLAADGTVIWDATANATYKNRITGIGREDCSDMIQRQSRNQDTTSAYATIGLGTIAATNIANTNNFSADESYLIWGDDNVAGASVSNVTGDGNININNSSCGVFRRLAKTFKVSEKGTVGNVQVMVNLRGVTLGKVAGDFYLAINNTATFTGVITKLVPAASYSNGVLTFNNVDFTDGQYFTVIGIKADGPANITNNLKLWLRADDGVTLSNNGTIDYWGDQGPAANDATQAAAAQQPTYNTGADLINFNPTVTFNGSKYMRTGANIFGTGNISYTTFGVVDHNTLSGNRYFLSDGSVGANQAAWFGHQGALQAQANWLNDLAAGPIALNIPYLEAFTRDGGTNTKTNYQSAKSMGNNTLAAINKTNNGFAEIGANTVNTEPWNGKVGEIIAYQGVLSAGDFQKVNTYLAIKWGFTLDQSTPYNYVSSGGTTIWDATAYSTYKHRITGIAREDCSNLQQKQSKSVETGALVTLSNGNSIATTNDGNTNTFSADNSWLIFGDNNRGITWTGSGVPINGGNVRLNRVWRVKETGTVGTVYLEVPDNSSSLPVKLPATTNNIYLLVANSSTNGKFSAMSGVTVQVMTFDAANKKWYTTYNFSDGDYFTFGSEKVCIAPVGISEGLTSWYHATDMAVGAIPVNTSNALTDQAFAVYPLNRNNAGTATVTAGSNTSFNYNRSIVLSGNAAFTKGGLTNTDVLESAAGSMFAVGTSNSNLFGISTNATDVSGLRTNALFNGTTGTYGAGLTNLPNIFAMIGSTTNVTGYTNGTAGVTSGSITPRASGTYTLGFGQNGSNANYNNGTIAEAFTFNRVLDPEERAILESYLAIKYGQTLSHDYYNADYDGSNAATTTIYDVDTYPNRVFGVGTDTTGCFYQKQSTSALSGSMLKMTVHTSFAAENSGNTGTFLQDRSYVMAGDNDGSIAAWVVGGGANPDTPAIYVTTCVIPTRINRQWKVTGTYTTPNILFAIPDNSSSEATKLPAVTSGFSVWMVINGNTDFGINAFQQEVQMTLNGVTNHWECQYQIPPGETKYITFVMKDDDIATGAAAPMIEIAETDNSCAPDDSKVLSGGAALLTPTSGASYIWNGGATTATLSVNPTSSSTYSVTVTALNGCTGTASAAVTVITGPTATISETDNSCAADDSQVLSGDPATLTASGGGTYVWDNMSGAAVRMVNPTMNSTYTVTVSDANGCTHSATKSINIVTPPTVNLTGSNEICIGEMTGVSPTSGGTWLSSDPGVASVTNAGVVTGESAGTVSFTFTSSSSGCVSAATPTVTVNGIPVVNITGSNNICVGSTTTLSPTSGGSWSSSDLAIATVTNAGVVTGVSAGTVTFTYTNSATGCISDPTSNVTVTALPVVNITGSSTICAGSTTTLSPTSGGTWTSSDPTIASVTNAGVVTGINGGVVTFTYTKNTAPNCSATTSSVTVNALTPVNITGASVICAGGTTTLSPTSGGTWVSNNPLVASVTNAGVVTGLTAGTATFTYTNTATGCASAPTSPVTVNALPVVSITGADAICAGSTTTLSPSSGGTWSSSAPAVATVTNAGVVTGVSAGTATFTFVQTSTGCISDPTPVVTVSALPVVNITGSTTICVAATTTLTPTSGGTWTSSNPSVATVTNAGVVTGVANGTATFTFTSSTSPYCTATTGAVSVDPLPVVSITGASTICVGMTTSLSPTSGGSWTSSNPSVATVTNAGIVTGVSSGSVTFKFTLSSTGCESLPTSSVTVNALPVVSITGSDAICVDATTTLSPTSGGSWTSSNPSVATVTNAGVVTGISAGTASFTFTNSITGCVSAPTPLVTINPIPTVNITGATGICIGDMSGLSPTTGGTWSSSNPSVASVTNAGIVTGLSAGTATFTFTNSSTGCVSAPTAAITVHPVPTVSIAGSSSICISETTTLLPTNGIWTSSNPSIATVTNAGLVTGVAAGMATFIFTNTTTGCESDPTSPVTVNATPSVSITGSTAICVGAGTTLSPTTGGTWSSSDPAVATVTNAGVVSGVSAGSATFIFTDGTTGCESLPTPAVTVNPLPTVSINGSSSICIGATTGLSPNSGGTWSSSNPSVATVTNAGIVTGVSAGSATFTFTNSTTGCVSAPTAAVTVNPTPTVSITGATSICENATTTLSPSSGGTWVSTTPSVATVTNAGVVTGISAGTSTFIFTNSSTGCVSDPTPAVTVNPTPIVSIVGSSSLCISETTNLSPSSGGTWASSNASVASVTNAGVVTALAAGSATFTFTNTTTGCVSAPTPAVTVNSTPTVNITGSTTICVNGTTTLSPTTGGTWSSSNPAVATVSNSGVVTGVSAGTATFTFTSSGSGCQSAPTGPVTVNALPAVSITGASTICVNANTTLSPTSGGSWTSSNPAVATVTNSGIVSGLSAGTATFTFTSSITGCQSAPTLPVTVNALPTVSITGSNSICVGQTTTLSPNSGGTWASSNPAVATVSNTGVVTGVSAGSATFTFTHGTTGCISLPTGAVTIHAIPVVSVTGSSSICIGSTTTLSPTTGGTWTSSNPAVATVTNSGVVTGVSAGTVTFTFTNGSTGCMSAPTAPVTINPDPAVSITGSSSVCVGQTTNLSPVSGGTWASSNPAVATVTNAGVVTGISAGTVTFTFTDGLTGCISDPTGAVTVNAAPIVSITGSNSICVGNTTTLSPTTGGTWSSSNPGIATVTNGGVVTGVSAGSATFTFTSTATGCSSAPTSPVMVNALPTVSITGNNSICIGATTTLTPTTGGTWSSSNPAVATVTNAGVVTGVGAGTVTFTFTNSSTGCISNPTGVVTVAACNSLVAAKAFLGGPYDPNTDLMFDHLRAAGLIPTNQPYGEPEYNDFNYTGSETIGAGVLNVTGDDAIIDWVLLELRDAANPSLVVAKKAALIQADGDIVESSDGVSEVEFVGTPADDYYVVLRHRTHLGVMTSVPVTLSGTSGTVVNYTSAGTGNYQLSGPTGSVHAQRTLANGKRALWEGNMSNLSGSGDLIQYQGGSSDSDEAYYRVLLDPGNIMIVPNYIVNGYERADGNMDGMVIYQGSDSDSDIPFFIVLAFPDNVLFLPNFIVYEQIP